MKLVRSFTIVLNGSTCLLQSVSETSILSDLSHAELEILAGGNYLLDPRIEKKVGTIMLKLKPPTVRNGSLNPPTCGHRRCRAQIKSRAAMLLYVNMLICHSTEYSTPPSAGPIANPKPPPTVMIPYKQNILYIPYSGKIWRALNLVKW